MDEDNYEPHHSKTPFEQLELADGELPSIGSELHASGECKRCAFFSKGRCQNGKECSHCHFPHDERRRRKNRRGKVSANVENEELANSSDAYQEENKDPNVPSLTSSLQKEVTTEVGKAVSLPSCAQDHQFDSTIMFGTVTPEEQIADSAGVRNQEEKGIDIDKLKGSTEAVAFSSVFNVPNESSPGHSSTFSSETEKVKVAETVVKEVAREAEETIKCMPSQKRAQLSISPAQVSISPGTPGGKSPDLAQLEKMAIEAEEEAAKLEAEAMSVELEAQRIAKSYEDDRKLPTVTEIETTAGESAASEEGSCETAELLSSESDSGSLGLNASSSCNESQERKISKEQTIPKQGRRLQSPLWPNRAPTETGDSPSSSDELVKDTKTNPKSWTAHAKQRRLERTLENEPQDDVAAVARRARGLLNKLTEKNFDAVYQQLLDCGVCTKAQLEAVVMEIFEKATTQHIFLRMYVELAEKMDKHFKKEPIDGCDFRKILVGACQRTFERNLRVAPPVDSNMSYEEKYEAQVKFKTRMLGNLRFVGELLIRKLLVGKILLAVAEELLSIGDGASIEAAVTLLEVAGPSFDRDSWVFVPRLRAIFSMMRPMSADPAVPMRVRCIVKDLLDFRDRGWCAKEASKASTVMPSRKF